MGFLINYTCHTDCTHTPDQTHKSTNMWKKIEYQIPAVKLQRILLYKDAPAYRAPNISIVSCYLTTLVSCCRPNEVASFSLMLFLSLTHTHGSFGNQRVYPLIPIPIPRVSVVKVTVFLHPPAPSLNSFNTYATHATRHGKNTSTKKKRQVHCTVSPPLRTRIHLTLFFCRMVLQTRAPPPPPPHPPPAANFKSDIRL